jgi:hypothetical protein
LYKGEIELLDEYGNLSGEKIVTYEDDVMEMANISTATGQSNTEQFGNLENYDKVIVIDDLDCPIDENSVLFIDKEPEYKDAEYNEQTAITITGATVKVPVYDYIVRRVAKSLNSISIAVSKVKVS